ncbi:MAG: hypothetical protein ABIK47_05540 [candidate division WOR-3 bacterium]
MSVSVKTKKKMAKKLSKLARQKAKESPRGDLGICATCNNLSHCGYRKDNKQPVVFCEEFDSTVPTVTEEVVLEHFPTPEEMSEWDEYKGLCINCENRKDCAIRNREIGVWHCEEYR